MCPWSHRCGRERRGRWPRAAPPRSGRVAARPRAWTGGRRGRRGSGAVPPQPPPPRSGAGQQHLDPGLERKLRRVVPDLGCQVWAGGHEDARARPAYQLDNLLSGQAAVDRHGDSGQLSGQRGGDELVRVRSHQGDRVGAAHAERVQHVGVAMHVGQQLGEGALQRLVPAAHRRASRTARRGPARGRRPGPTVRRSCRVDLGRPRALTRPQSGPRARHTAATGRSSCTPDDGALPAEVDRPVVGADLQLEDVARFEVLGVVGLALEVQLPLQRGRQSAAMISTGLGGALSAVPSGVPVRTTSPTSRRWKRLNACRAATGE